MTGGSTGELVVLGAEYSVKALFPDKEPTDHEVRGKQLFSIQPPHLNTSSGNKNTSQAGVGDDNMMMRSESMYIVPFSPEIKPR